MSDTLGPLKESLVGAPPPLHPTLTTSSVLDGSLVLTGEEVKGPTLP